MKSIGRGKNQTATIEVKVPLGLNYICFVMANQGINWMNRYREEYAGFLTKEHAQVMQDASTELSFRNADGGILALPFFFFPAYLNLDTEASFFEYYALLSQAVSSGKWSQLEKRYKTELHHIRKFMPYYLNNSHNGRPSADNAAIVKALGDVFCDNFHKYQSDVWDKDKAMLDKIAIQIPELWGGEDIIAQWEKQTKLVFNAPAYNILIVSAMTGGPSANSLAFDTNTFGVWDKEDCMHYLRHFISHEVGTHLLVPVTTNKLKTNKSIYLGYIAMESLAQYLNVKMFHFTDYNDSDKGYYHSDYFQDLYSKLDKQFPHADVKTLFRLAVKKAAKDNITAEKSAE